MTHQELHQTFESRARDLNGFIYLKTNGNEDMVQEARAAVWSGLQKDAYATDAYLRTREILGTSMFLSFTSRTR